MRAPAPVTEFDGRALGNVVGRVPVRTFPRGSWQPVALCGRGGLAEVWRAVATDGSEAALKRLKPELENRSAFEPVLRREHALLRSGAGPSLVAALDLLESDAGPELVLEYLPNGDLVSLLGAPPRYWLPALRAVVGAVARLHEHGVAHGDLKARNVLFAADETPRLIDLTAARPVDAPAGHGTAAYGLPPGAAATARMADCFALAVLVYELVTGRLPYGEAGAAEPLERRTVTGDFEPAAERLLAAATAVLEAGGRQPPGLSYLADVIESVGATGA